MSTAETIFWMVFIFVCVVGLHPAIDVVIERWKLDDSIAWERSKRCPTWNRMQRLYLSKVDAFKIHDRHIPEYRTVRKAAWGKYLRNEITLVEAVKFVETWTEGKK